MEIQTSGRKGIDTDQRHMDRCCGKRLLIVEAISCTQHTDFSYLVFCQRSIKLVPAIGGLLHQVVPVIRQLIHLVLDVGSGKVLSGNETTSSVENSLNHRLTTLQLNVQFLQYIHK